ncbi:MAG TPA: biotin--[acetyl-CoA-carboxylase] ligase [Actinomycetota bacterium]|nr:biotin--[acetyl-CoA-carboxylase] ligase [Actinomycetota bacterium]
MDDLSSSRMLSMLAGTRFTRVDVVEEIDSTQTVLVAEGGPDGRVLIADHQSAGRGRQGRTWTASPGTSLLMSALLRDVPADRAPLVGLAASLAVARALDDPRVGIKWPNDVQVSGRKVCGVLGELAQDGAVVVGIGLNVHQGPGDLPPDVEATSLAIEGLSRSRDVLAARVLLELDPLASDTDWLPAYRDRCTTIGSRVVVTTPSGPVVGTAEGVRDDGALLVDGRAVTTGDVTSVR